MPASIDDVLAGITPVSRSVPICLDGALGAERDALEAEMRAALAEDDSLAPSARAVELAEQIQGLEARAAEHTATFTFRSIGSWRWDELLGENAPTKEQREEGHDHNPFGFQPAVVAEACTEPTGVTVAKAERLKRDLSPGQWDKLWATCFLVNRGPGDLPKSKAASVVTAASARRSKQASEPESLAASS